MCYLMSAYPTSADQPPWGSRRRFLHLLGKSALFAPVLLHATGLGAVRQALSGMDHDRGGPADEAYWATVRQGFSLSPDLILLNHGGVSPTPNAVHEAHLQRLMLANQGPSFYMWRKIELERERLHQRLAALAGCQPDEIALNRNATEGLTTVILGLPLRAGDEVVLSRHDYPSALAAWQQRERRDGIVLRWVTPPLFGTDAELTAVYAAQMNRNTRLVHLTHITNWTGQVFPARAIADAAHAHGAELLLDAAHSFAVYPFSFAETGADYAAASLHKWLCAPYGTGVLMVRKANISHVWPLIPAPADEDATSIRKFEHLGTHSLAAEMAVHEAIDLHEQIGQERKRKRLMYLKHYWTSRVADVPGVMLLSAPGEDEGSGIATFRKQGVPMETLQGELLTTYKIHTSPVHLADIQGVRVTPHVFTTPAELDVLVEAVKKA